MFSFDTKGQHWIGNITQSMHGCRCCEGPVCGGFCRCRRRHCSLLWPMGPPTASPRCLVARAPRALARARATRPRLKCFAFAAPGSGSPGSPGCVGLADSTRCAHTRCCYHLQRATSPDAVACLRLDLPPARLRRCHTVAVARALRASACYREASRCGVRTPPHRLPRRG